MGRSYTDIKYDLWYNLEKLGISPGNIGLAVKCNPGGKTFSHGYLPIVGNNSLPFKHDKFQCNGSSGLIDFGDILDEIFLSDFTFLSEFTASSSGSGFDFISGKEKTSANYVGVMFFIWGISTPRLTFRATDQATQIFSLASVRDDIEHIAIGTRSGSTNHLYLDGVFQSTQSTTLASMPSVNFLMGYNNIASEYHQGTLGTQLVLKGALSAYRVKKLSNIDIWKPRPDISYFDQAAPPSTLLQGNLSQSGSISRKATFNRSISGAL